MKIRLILIDLLLFSIIFLSLEQRNVIAEQKEQIFFEKYENGRIIRHLFYKDTQSDVEKRNQNCFVEKRNNGTYYTQDFGRTWENFNKHLGPIVFIEKRPNGDILKTEDFGKTWINLGSEKKQNLLNLQNVEGNKELLPKKLFRIYPNPATETIEIFIENKISYNDLKIHIYDILGQKIISKQWHVNETCKLDLNNVSRGIYTAVVVGPNGIIGMEKLIKR